MAYCSKVDTRADGPWTLGDEEDIPQGQGARSDVLSVKRALESGSTVGELFKDDDHFPTVLRNYNALQTFKRHCAVKRTWATKNIILIGASGTGKTRFVSDNHPDAYWVPPKKGSGMYFDDYMDHEVVLFDETKEENKNP